MYFFYSKKRFLSSRRRRGADHVPRGIDSRNFRSHIRRHSRAGGPQHVAGQRSRLRPARRPLRRRCRLSPPPYMRRLPAKPAAGGPPPSPSLHRLRRPSAGRRVPLPLLIRIYFFLMES